MIAKVIHYCWFGGNPLPPMALQCIKSWKKYCPGYKIIAWNENNFDIALNTYAREAYQAKKYAFVSDVARLWVLTNYGGVYMDTDCELIKPIDKFLHHEGVCGFESPNQISTALMGCRAGHSLFAQLLDDYNNRSFALPGGRFDMTTNVTTITNTLRTYGLCLNGKLQTINGLTLYPVDFFSPMDEKTGSITLTDNTCAIHHFDASWLTTKQRTEYRRINQYRKNFGRFLGVVLYALQAVITLRISSLQYIFEKINNRINKNK